MEDKAIRKGLSVTAIVFIVISCLLLSFNDTHEKLFGRESTLYGIPFIFAFAIPLIAILIILTRYYNNTDTMEEIAEQIIAAIEDLMTIAKIPTVRELGHTPDEIDALVEAGMKDPLNFVSVTPEEFRSHLEYLFNK